MRRIVSIAVAAVVVAGVLVVVGRNERSRWTDRQNAGIAHVRALVGRLDSSRLSGYRYSWTFDCLAYTTAGVQYGAELCFDPQGRVVEAIDRTKPTPQFWTLRMAPSEATVRIGPSVATCVLRLLGAPIPAGQTAPPIHTLDQGILFGKRKKGRCTS